jgi:hypothetical protein
VPALALLGRWQASVRAHSLGTALSLARAGCFLLVLLAACVRLAAGTHNPFIYFRF